MIYYANHALLFFPTVQDSDRRLVDEDECDNEASEEPEVIVRTEVKDAASLVSSSQPITW